MKNKMMMMMMSLILVLGAVCVNTTTVSEIEQGNNAPFDAGWTETPSMDEKGKRTRWGSLPLFRRKAIRRERMNALRTRIFRSYGGMNVKPFVKNIVLVVALVLVVYLTGGIAVAGSTAWFSVNKEGLGKLMEGRHKSFILNELFQNAWDTDADEVEATLIRQPNSPFVEITVKDNNPKGFNDIAHAYTLFAESEKKTDPTKRGRFNMGEKMVLALARNARISTTTGAVIFDEGQGYRLSRRAADKTDVGSIVWMEVRMTRQEEEEVRERINWLLPPEFNTEEMKMSTTFDGEEIEFRKPLTMGTNISLKTVADTQGDGILRSTKRQTTIEIHKPRAGEVAMVYEMGLPVVELPDDKYSVNVMQKVPMDLSRDNIPPSFRRALRGEVLNLTANLLSKEDAMATWVKEALEHDNLDKKTIDKTMDKMFGEKRAIFNPQDPEANALATSAGYTIVSGGSLSTGAWNNVKSTGKTVSSSRVGGGRFESYGHSMKDAVGGVEMRLREDEWTDGMKQVACLAIRMFELRGVALTDLCIVRHQVSRGGRYSAKYGNGHLTFNLNTLGRKWFDMETNLTQIVELLVHEMAHRTGRISKKPIRHDQPEFYKHIEDSAGIFVKKALTEKSFFKPVIKANTLKLVASYCGQKTSGAMSLMSLLDDLCGDC